MFPPFVSQWRNNLETMRKVLIKRSNRVWISSNSTNIIPLNYQCDRYLSKENRIVRVDSGARGFDVFFLFSFLFIFFTAMILRREETSVMMLLHNYGKFLIIICLIIVYVFEVFPSSIGKNRDDVLLIIGFDQ